MKNPLKLLGDFYYIQKYKKIKKKDFSIICSNCIGGVISHYARAQFMSPTVNLWIKQDDFIKMCLNLKYYMSKDLEFIKTEYNHPVAKCDDITIYFNHDSDEKEAEDKWNRRKTRINYDNLFIIMYNGDGVTKEDLEKLEMVPCKNKVVFTPQKTDYDLPYMFYFKPSRGGGFFDLKRNESE